MAAVSMPAPEPRAMRVRYEACPLCASQRMAAEVEADCSRHPLYKPGLPARITWMRCDDCGHSFTSGYWNDEALAILFADANAHQKAGADFERQRLVSARLVEKVLAYRDRGRWLDVGFGNGALLFTAKEFGFEPVGLDLRREGVEHLRRAGIEAHAADIAAFAPSTPFAVASLHDVVEHMPFPRRAFEAAARLVEPGGVLFVSMPNRDSEAWRQLDAARANPYWGELEHYHNFTRSSLYAELARAGFEPVRYGVSERYRAGMEVVALRAAV